MWSESSSCGGGGVAADCTLIGEHLLANVDIKMADLTTAACTLIGEHLLANVDIQMADLRVAARTLIAEHLLANVDIQMADTRAAVRNPADWRRESFWSTGTEPVAQRPGPLPYPTRGAYSGNPNSGVSTKGSHRGVQPCTLL